MSASSDFSVLDLPPVPDGHVAVDDLDWAPDTSLDDHDAIEFELEQYSAKWNVTIELRQLRNPASMFPTVRLSGLPANVLRALLAYNGVINEDNLHDPQADPGAAEALETFAHVYDFETGQAKDHVGVTLEVVRDVHPAADPKDPEVAH